MVSPVPPNRRSAVPTSPVSSTGTLAQMDLRQALTIIRTHFWVAISLALIVCTILGWQLLRQPKLYSSSARIMVERPERVGDIRQLGDNANTFGEMSLQLTTRMQQILGEDMLNRVVASMTLQERSQIVAPYGSKPEDLVIKGIIKSSVTATLKESTTLISITATNRDPQVAALLANRFVEQFIRYVFDKNSAGSDAALSFLRDRADELRAQVETAERDLQAYRQRYNLVSLEQNQNIVVDRMKALNSSATEARVTRLTVETRLKQAESVLSKADYNIEQLALIGDFSALTGTQGKIDDLKARRVVMAERYGRLHPAMQENQRSLEALSNLRDQQVKAAMENLRGQLASALNNENQLTAQLADAEKDSLRLDQLGVEYNVLRRALDTQKATYSQLLTKLNEASISAQLQSVNVKLSDRASVPLRPFSPNPGKIMLLLTVMGVFILVGYPFAVEVLFARVRNSLDVEYYLGTILLGEISRLREAETDRPHLVSRKRDGEPAEQFRALYSQLQLTSRLDPPKTLLITSTVPGEGKSFIASNLASAFAVHGRRVLLMDCDLRRPTLHRNYQLDNDAGIIKWLKAEVRPDEAVDKDPRLGIVEIHPGLYLLRAGGVSRNISEFVASGQLVSLVEALQSKFDIVIVDTPPAGIFPDAAAIARVCHELVYVCRFNKTSRQQVRVVLERLRKTGLDFPGIVLNSMPVGFLGSHYYSGYGYYGSKHYKNYEQATKS